MTYFTPAIDAVLKSSFIRDAEFCRLTIQSPPAISNATSATFSGNTMTLSGTITGNFTPGSIISGFNITTGTYIVSGSGDTYTISNIINIATGTNVMAVYNTSTSYSFSNSYRTETITDQDNVSSLAVGSYTPLGALLSVSGHQRDLSATSYDTQITLVGIDPSKISLILEIGLDPTTNTYHSGLKGSKIQIWRGFYDDKYELIDTPQLRYTGIVTAYTISENREKQDDTFILSLKCSSFKTVLENRYAGRHTNGASWNNYNGTNYLPDYNNAGVATNPLYDTGMDRVAAIFDTVFNFGLKAGS